MQTLCIPRTPRARSRARDRSSGRDGTVPARPPREPRVGPGLAPWEPGPRVGPGLSSWEPVPGAGPADLRGPAARSSALWPAWPAQPGP